MFFVQVAEMWPRAYVLVPAEQAPSRGYRYAPAPAFVVHSKDGGTYKKPQPFVVRGINRDELLVQKIGDGVPEGFETSLISATQDAKERYRSLHADGAWHTLRFDNTTEGYRFVRTIRKAVELLAKLAREGQKDRAKIAKAAKDFEDRGQRCGICPCCFGDYVADKSTGAKMVHHGYERPGDGMIHGDCYGVGYAPYEVSCEGTKFYRGIVQSSLKLREQQLTALMKLTEIQYQTGRGSYETRPGVRHGQWVPEYATAQKGSREFKQEFTSQRDTLERHIANLTRHIADLTVKIDTWAPQAFPRKA
jgi:hypothetical protein